ncbi:MAG: 16S rRNA (cytidine(1402)-2'-O)-methyltransferase [Ruminococcaceae bacterium]|nr:16S rRNA (cytidine(1402)-2'-O)-methyltransferase [Oscillospiraceae bacterium]
MPGTLYLVPTPIGNLSDISDRCRAVLADADFIAAEDTRVSLRLLNALDLKKELVSYHEHNKARSGPAIVKRLESGETCALVTDAGTPAISDPGEDLVRLCIDAGITVCAIPGPCALVTALCASGLPTGRFCFEGFLPMQKKERAVRLAELKSETRTMIFYEAPHRLGQTLEALAAAFGGGRRISLCRELTKLYEEYTRTTLAGALELLQTAPPRGEYVLVVEGAQPVQNAPDIQAAVRQVQSLMRDGLSRKAAAKHVAEQTGIKKNELYEASLAINETGEA